MPKAASNLPGGRRLGYAEFGDPSGDPVLWFHGAPGGRRQLPLLGRRAAEKLKLRVVLLGRPGSGLSDPHPYDAIADWATDVTHVADALGAERLAVVGLSGGGPYALACAAVPPLASRSPPSPCWVVWCPPSVRTRWPPAPSTWPAASPPSSASCAVPSPE